MLSRLMTRKEQLVLLAFAGALVVGAAALTYNRMGGVETQTEQAGRPHHNEIEQPQAGRPHHNEIVQPQANPKDEAPPVPTAQPEPAEPVPVVVSAAGEVVRPNVYTMPEGARVQDLLEHAGGLTPLGDVSDINLAARLIDGSTLTIPARRAPGVRARPAAQINPPHYTISCWQPVPAPSLAEAPAPNTPAPATEVEQAGGLIDLNSARQEILETLPGIGPKLAAEIIAYRARAPFASVDDLTNVSGIGTKKLEAVRRLVTVR